MKIAVIGDGGWGTATAMLLSSYGHEVTVWGPFADYVEELTSIDLLEFLQSEDEQDSVKFRKMLQEGIDNWLDDFAKTFAIM